MSKEHTHVKVPSDVLNNQSFTTVCKAVIHHLEYASGAWNPHLKNDRNKLAENIQMKASRFVKRCNSIIVDTRELS